MKIKSILIVALIAIAGSLGYVAFNESQETPKCVPRAGEAYCMAHAGAWPTFSPNKATAYSFFIMGKDGKVIKDFTVAHEKLLHLIVVRKDLGIFKHLHPELDAKTGKFTIKNLVLPTDGAYRIFADFTQVGKDNAVAYEDVARGDSRAYPAEERLVPKTESEADGYVAQLTANPLVQSGTMTTLAFTITKNGIPVTDLEPYLGAMAHAVIVRNGTLEYVHAHEDSHETHASGYPLISRAHAHGLGSHQTGTISLMTTFPFGGDYKIFLQIKHKGIVHTFDLAVPVLQGAPGDHGEDEH